MNSNRVTIRAIRSKKGCRNLKKKFKFAKFFALNMYKHLTQICSALNLIVHTSGPSGKKTNITRGK